MFDWFKKIVLNKYLAAGIRHALNAVGTVLIANGLAEAVTHSFIVELGDFIINGLPAWIALTWSLIEKKKKIKS